ncbi:SDR family oxidoreductase [Rarobacter faecitabidus]|uniref:Short-subunit dehydrogenase n=1 Tax=Rarobacter faecitabidus TaxID=13243 RepID=A0A542ZE65_RARFA|nr:SDR family NAD(P)-dependent oxidoreductase [Rarobacter faecitabidus]TQL58645.1 hypothetical protein FB461_2063 [Rarobacter faecitabidus]
MGTALITGASSGLGEEFAWQLATDRHDLVLVARSQDRLRALADRIHQVAGVTVEVLPADLSTAEGRAQVAERLSAGTLSQDEAPVAPAPGQLAPIGLLVNNAGYALHASFIGEPVDDERAALDVMVTAVLELSHAAAAQMVSRGRGAIINVSSVASYMAGSTYAAHKAWVRVFTESLASDLRGTGVVASAVLPGLTRTEFHGRAGIDEHQFPDIAWLSPISVVAHALDAARRGRVLITPSARYQSAAALLRILPRWIVREIGPAGARGQ